MEKIFTVDKFLGLNEYADSPTELKMGEATKIENFYITNDYNLKTRPGVVASEKIPGEITGFWDGMLGEYHFTFITYTYNKGTGTSTDFPYGQKLKVICRNQQADALKLKEEYNTLLSTEKPIQFILFGDKLYLFGSAYKAPDSPQAVVVNYSDNDFIHGDNDGPESEGVYYRPMLLTDCDPNGSGKEMESINIFTQYARVRYSADGETKEYKMPSAVGVISGVKVDGKYVDPAFDDYHTKMTFATAPPKGVNNIEVRFCVEESLLKKARSKFSKMRYSEAYNGDTDSRLFFYGDGTNVCYYTGVPAYGSGLYLPIDNEIAVDSSASPVTGLCRHYSKLMAYKPDGAFSIVYEPVTLADGRVIAGFYVRPASRNIGNTMNGQVQTVNNYPRTLCGGSLYEWRQTSGYRDERYAKKISDNIARTLAGADPDKIITCDDNTDKTYYMFLNDDAGTVLVNRYDLDVWTVYTGEAFKNIKYAVESQGQVLFCNETTLYTFDKNKTFDYLSEDDAKKKEIPCCWESGFMSFGADYKRKYSSNIWVSVLPEINSFLEVNVETDRRDEDPYLAKQTGIPLFNFTNMDFSRFSFLCNDSPKINRIKMKVKKFVYYKLKFRVNGGGSRATVMGYDQQVRYSSNVK